MREDVQPRSPAMWLKPLLQWASPAGSRARLQVLIFHRVLPEPDPIFPEEMHARRFDAICGWLASWFNVLPLDEAVRHLKAGSLPARAACITFDDGYADNYRVAQPILKRHGLTATFFIATNFLDGGRMWNDTIIEAIRGCHKSVLDLTSQGLSRHALDTIANRRAAIDSLIGQIKYRPPEERITITEQLRHLAGGQSSQSLMMTSDEVRAMRHAGMQIGAHTMSHPILARLTDEEAQQEIAGSKRFLEQLLGERVGLVADPNGKPGEDYTPQSVDAVRRLGFDAAVSTRWGALATGGDLYQIPRFTPWDQNRQLFGTRLLFNLRSG